MSKATITIPKGIQDEHYRYKRPELQVTYPGNIKTKLENISEISLKYLITPPEYPLKFIGYELGSQTTKENDDFIISGKHSLDKLEELLEKFIGKYIICSSKSCKFPEMRIFIKKKDNKQEEIRGKCAACSHIATLDNKHKMSGYILKNPPTIYHDLEKDKKETKGDAKGKVSSSSSKFTPDIKTIKATIKKLTEELSKGNNASIESLLKSFSTDKNQSISSPECKYFIIVHSLYGKDIYKEFESKSNFLKYVSFLN